MFQDTPRLRQIMSNMAMSAILLSALAALAGCATHSGVSASNEIATARYAIRDARASGAETYAFESLRKADTFLEEAQSLSGREAERMAEKATAYAQLAATVAQREGARKQLRDAQRMEQEAEALRLRTTTAVEDRLQ